MEVSSGFPAVAKVSSNSLQQQERLRLAQRRSHNKVFRCRWLKRVVKKRKLLWSDLHICSKADNLRPREKVVKDGLKTYRVIYTDCDK